MSAILLSPHHDDETLFAAFTIIRERPKVIVVLESHLQRQRAYMFGLRESHVGGPPITNDMRQQETVHAMERLGLDPYDPNYLEFMPHRDDRPEWRKIARSIEYAVAGADHVYAPTPYPLGGGHVDHNEIGRIAIALVPSERLTLYDTYVNGDTRITDGTEVEYEPEWVAQKLRALACYESQIKLWPHHFIGDQREYYS